MGLPRSAAEDLRKRLSALTVKANLDREAFLMAILACAAPLAAHQAYAPREALGPDLTRSKVELSRKVQEYHARSLAVDVEATLMARRLQTYRETGVLPPETADDGSIARALEAPIPDETPDVAALSLDLVVLAKQLGVPPPAREVLPAAPTIVRRARPKTEGAYMRDAGTGRAAGDPVPALIVQLSSENARVRASAADALGHRGSQAAPAVAALRRALSDADARVRSSSVTALGSIVRPDSEAVADIRLALADKNEDVRFSARAALHRLEDLSTNSSRDESVDN